MKMKVKYNKNGDCCFFSALLGTVILLSFLFILGVPKFVIAVEYWNSCPAAPSIPIYLCITGLLGVACVGHSAFLWACMYRRQMKKKASHDFCLVLWVFIMLTVPVAQLIGAPYIIHMYHTNSYNTTGCDVTANLTVSASNFNQSSKSFLHANGGVTIDTTNTSESSYIVNPESNITVKSTKQDNQVCHYCSDVLMTSAYGMAIFEVIFMTLPIVCLVLSAVVFRIRTK